MSFKSIKKFLDIIHKIIWTAVFLIILATVGKYLLSLNKSKTNPVPRERKVPITINWKKVDNDTVQVIKTAESKAEEYAKEQLQNFNSELKNRIDKNFLPWYFSYWTQQKLGLLSLYHAGLHILNKNHPTAVEAITEKVQTEFAERVLRPEVSQLELEQISRNSLKIFLSSLSEDLSKIPKKYNIPQQQWNNYLKSISIMIRDTEGGREIPLSLKTIISISAAGGGKLLIKNFSPSLSKVTSIIAKKIAAKTESKLAVKLSEKLGAKAAEKSAGKVLAKSAGEMLSGLIGIGIIVWDFYDHYRTKKTYEPILRKNLYDYVDLMTKELLEDTRNGVLSPVYQVEEQIIEAIESRKENKNFQREL